MVLEIDNVAGTLKVPREEHVMKRRGHGAQEWREGTREEASTVRYSIAKDGSPMLAHASTPCGIEPRWLGMYII